MKWGQVGHKLSGRGYWSAFIVFHCLFIPLFVVHSFLPTWSSVILWRLSRPRQSTQDWQEQTCCKGSSWQWASINTAWLCYNSGNCLLYLSHFFSSSFSLLTIIQLFFQIYVSVWELLPSTHPDGFCSRKLFTSLHCGMAQTPWISFMDVLLFLASSCEGII